MSIAILHNVLDNIGGAEVVGLTLAEAFGADVYSTNIDNDKIQKMGFQNILFKSIGRIPINAPFRQQSALSKFHRLKLNGTYNFYLIDGDWAMSAAVNNKPNLWYVHSPMREIWDLYEYTRENTVPWYARWAFDGWVWYNRRLNREYIRHVEKLACNSVNTKNRIKKYFNRDAEVIYPPIDTQKFHYAKNGDYWLSVNRLITHKRVDIQLEAFRKLRNEKLIIVGSYEQSRHFRRYAGRAQQNKPDNVEILSWVDQGRLVELYAHCKGFITTAKDEDFGMTAVEAMASGKPVIAPDEGGYRESVINGVTGVLIDQINTEKLIEAIEDVGHNPQRYRQACLDQAKNFDKGIFIEKIRKLVYGP